MKCCPKCNTEKAFDQFHKSKSRKDGCHSWCKQCRYEHEDRSRIYGYTKEWRKQNPEKHRSYRAKRRAAELQATPKWADFEKIEAYYAIANWLEAVVPNQKYHVDHVVPLVNKNVCGLHVHNNLSVLRAELNSRKSNKFDIE